MKMKEINRKKPSDKERAECAALFAIFEQRKAEGFTLPGGEKLNQENLASLFPQKIGPDGIPTKGISQGGVGHYLKGRNALNVKCAIVFSRALSVPISDFSKRLAAEASSSSEGNEALLDELANTARHLRPEQIRELTEIAKIKVEI